jgi:FAD/FMN-containing dehydrogenase
MGVNNNTITEEIEKFLDAKYIISGEELNDRYNHIWKMNDGLKAKALLLPKYTQEISEICKLCYAYNQPIIVFGGLTNLVGSTVTEGNEIVISMERMSNIEEVDEISRTMTVEAGVILENAQNAAKEKDLLFPLNYGAKGSAQIGGAISTNAGGLRVLKYGMTRNLILGLEVVKMDGTIISSMKKITKDNSAYDLKQLFIGSEGTLGIVTKAVLKLIELPTSRQSAFVAFNNYERVTAFLKFVDKGLAGTLSGYELMWDNFYQCSTSEGSINKPVLPWHYKYYVLIESLGSDPEKNYALMERLLTEAMEKEMILDGALANSASDLENFWKIREEVSIIKTSCTIDQHFDVSVPIPEIGSYVEKVTIALEKISGVNKVYSFGHVADGNIHFIVDKEDHSDELRKAINAVVYNPITVLNGSVSAEHGIGLDKKEYLKMCRTPEEIALMLNIKKIMDPKNLLNPGKVLDVKA